MANLTDADRIFVEELLGYANMRHRLIFNTLCGNYERRSWFRDFFIDHAASDYRWKTLFGMEKRVFVFICYELAVWTDNASTTVIDESVPGPFPLPSMERTIPIPEQLGATVFQLIHACAISYTAERFGIDVDLIREVMENCFDCIDHVFRRTMEMDQGDKWKVDRYVQLGREKLEVPNLLGVIGFSKFNFDILGDVNIQVPILLPVEVTMMVVCDAAGLYQHVHLHFNSVSSIPHCSYSNWKVLRTSTFFHTVRENSSLHPQHSRFIVDLPPGSITAKGPSPFKECPLPRDLTGPSPHEIMLRDNHKRVVKVVREALQDFCDLFQVTNGKFFSEPTNVDQCLRACLILHNLMRMDAADFKHFFVGDKWWSV